MTPKKQLIALYTLVRREIVRMLRISTQVFLPPAITTTLYFLIFGAIMGQRIGPVGGAEYALFITPGLIMMAVITNAYSNVSTSLFSTRFQKNIEEMLVSPMHSHLLLLGFVLGGIVRGLIVSLLLFIVSLFFVDLNLCCLPAALGIITLVAAVFSLAGFTNAMLARTFDDVAIVPTFILAPLTYLGGVFYAVSMLPPFWKALSCINPIFYMVNALRYVMLGQQEVSLSLAILVIVSFLFTLLAINLTLLKRGVGMRE